MLQGEHENDRGSLLAGGLQRLTDFGVRHPALTLSFVLLVAVLCAAATSHYIRFKTERADLIDPQADFQQRWVRYTESFGDSSDIVVAVEAGDPETIKRVLDKLGSRLQDEPALFQNVFYKIEAGRLRGKGLQYLDPKHLETGLNRLEAYAPVLDGDWERVRLDNVLHRLQRQLAARTNAQNGGRPAESAEPGAESQKRRAAGEGRGFRSQQSGRRSLLRHAELLATSLQRFLEDRSDFRSPWPELVPADRRLRDVGREVTYLLNDDGTVGFLKATPVEHSDGFQGAAEAIRRVRALRDEIAPLYPDAEIGVTGIPVLEHDEMRRSQQDMSQASLISLAAVAVLLVLGFRGVRHPSMAVLMLGVGMAWTFGYTTAVVGHLNILSVSFAVILIGLGIDFGIHYMARYLELRHQGRELRPALLGTSSTVGTGIVAAAVTTSLAFLCATGTQFIGVAELGVIAGGGILLCALATFLVLPPLLSLSDRTTPSQHLPVPPTANSLRMLTLRHPWLTLTISLVVVAGIGSRAVRLEGGQLHSRIDYDYNLLHLQAEGLESVEVQRRAFRQAHDSLLFAVSLADSPDEARSLKREFEKLPTVHHVEELASLLPAHPPRKTELLVQAFRARLSHLPKQPPEIHDLNPAQAGKAAESLYLLLRDNADSASVEAAHALDGFLDGLDKLSLKQQTAFLSAYQYRMTAALLAQFRALAKAAGADPVTLNDLPPELTSRFVSDDGQWLVRIYPKEQIWDIGPLQRFVGDVRSVDPEVTGTPLQNYEASRQIKSSYETAALYALAVVSLVLFIDFLRRNQKLYILLPPMIVIGLTVAALNAQGRAVDPVLLALLYIAMVVSASAVVDIRNLRDTLLAMAPPLGGGLLMFGILAVFGIELNPANLIVLPLVLGIGVDDGVHVIHDFRWQRGAYRTSPSTFNAIVLTSLTSMIGFGSMMVAAHRGLYSVGLVLVIGVASCLFVSLVPLPAVLSLVAGRSDDADAQPAGQVAISPNPVAHRQQREAA